MKLKINETSRKSVNVELNDTWHNHGDFIEVTEWANGEGFDITLSTGQHISLHETEWVAIKKLVKHLFK